MSKVSIMLPAAHCLQCAVDVRRFVGNLSWMPPERIAYYVRLEFSELERRAALAGFGLVDAALVRNLRQWRNRRRSGCVRRGTEAALCERHPVCSWHPDACARADGKTARRARRRKRAARRR